LGLTIQLHFGLSRASDLTAGNKAACSSFQRALRTIGADAIELVFGRLTGSAVLQIAYPARDEAHQLKFVLLASLDLNRLIQEQIANLPPGARLRPPPRASKRKRRGRRCAGRRRGLAQLRLRGFILRDASRSLSSGAHSRDPLAMLPR
jgi:hypothetical protein